MTPPKCPLILLSVSGRSLASPMPAALLLLLMSAASFAQVNDSAKQALALKLIPNGEFHAEHGVFFIEGDQLQVYSTLPSIYNDKSGQWEPTPNEDGLKSQWKGEAFYRERFQLRQGKWVRVKRDFSTGPNAYLDFGPCDPADQLDLPSTKIKKTLPATAKVKSISEFHDYAYATVIYSRAPEQQYPRYSLDAYTLKVALLVRAGSDWQEKQTADIGADGFFCGARTLSARAPDGGRATVLLLYTDEPAASSNYRAIHSFIVASSSAQDPSSKYAEPEDHDQDRGEPSNSQRAAPGPATADDDRSAKPSPLPEKLVQVIADTESGLNAAAVHVIPRMESGTVLLDALGIPIPDTVNYGVMQINSINLDRTMLRDEHGEAFTISEDVMTDWKANARAGVALIFQQYELARQEQGGAGTEESYALQTFSGYNGGTRNRHRYSETTKN